MPMYILPTYITLYMGMHEFILYIPVYTRAYPCKCTHTHTYRVFKRYSNFWDPPGCMSILWYGNENDMMWIKDFQISL